MKLGGALQPETASKYFLYVSFLNMVIAAAATAPVLVPQLGLPLKLQIWPGTWMFVAYFSFLITGVVGVLGWSLIYYMLPRLLGIQSVSRLLATVHLALFEIGVVGATSLMGLIPGYVGGTLIHDGIGQFVVTRVIEWAVIPIGVFITVAILSTLAGIFNVFFSSRRG